MKTYRNQLFIFFMILTGSILAVLGFLLGQLFPFYFEKYAAINGIQLNHEEMNEVGRQFGIIITILVVVSFLLITIVANNIIRNVLTPIENIKHTTQELINGNYRARAHADGTASIVELKNSINSLAKNLQEIDKTSKIEEERLNTLIENMGSALIMIEREATVSIVNRRFLKNFNLKYNEVKGLNFLTIGLPVEVEEFIDYVFLTELPYRKQIEVQVGHEVQNMQVYGAPVMGDHGRWLGVVVVMHDISELIRLEQIRKDFVANVSHELRTPITSIKGFSETLLDGAFKDEKMLLSFLEIINQESNRLQTLIQDLLELSKIEQYGFSINIMPTSLQEVLIRAVDLTSPEMDVKEMQFNVDISRDVEVMGDLNRLIQIVTNLITNSITYAPDKTTITLRIKKNDKFGIIEVEDQGIGIEKNEIPRIFERFYRVDKARSRNSGGTGLGLAIVKHLVEAHRGKIEVESNVGEGTCMKVYIPLRK